MLEEQTEPGRGADPEVPDLPPRTPGPGQEQAALCPGAGAKEGQGGPCPGESREINQSQLCPVGAAS